MRLTLLARLALPLLFLCGAGAQDPTTVIQAASTALMAAYPGGLTACTIVYAPAIVPANPSSFGYDNLDQFPRNVLLTPPAVGGLDVDFTQLIFAQLAGVNVSYLVFDSFLELMVAVKNGQVCDFGIGFLDQGDLAANSCLPSCDNSYGNLTNFTADGDYDSSAAQLLGSKVCCLQSSVPYLYTGFGIASLVPATNPLAAAMDSFTSVSVIDLLLLLLLIVLCAALGLWFLDNFLPSKIAAWKARVEFQRSVRLGRKPDKVVEGAHWRPATVMNFADSVYWAITTMSSVGYGDVTPKSAPAKVFTAGYMALAMSCTALFSAILSASLTTGLLAGNGIDVLADISGTVCLEWNYQQLINFIEASPSRPSPIVQQPLGACFDLLHNGTVQAVVTTQVSRACPLPPPRSLRRCH